MITERVSGEKSFYSGKRPTRYAWLTPHWGLGGDRQSRLYCSVTTLFTRNTRHSSAGRVVGNCLISRSTPLPRVLGKLFDERPVDQNIGKREDLFDTRVAARD